MRGTSPDLCQDRIDRRSARTARAKVEVVLLPTVGPDRPENLARSSAKSRDAAVKPPKRLVS
jgi:hypothetical protein